MRTADAVCSQYDRPAGVVRRFQVSLYSIEPNRLKRIFNLSASFSDNERGSDLLTENVLVSQGGEDAVELRPEVSLVGVAFTFPRRRERLAGAASGDTGLVVWPSGKTQGKGPSGDSAEEVQLGESNKFLWLDFNNASFIHDSVRDFTRLYEIANPFGRILVNFVVEVH